MEAEITDEEQMNSLLKHISRGKPFPTWYFHPRKASVVKSVPDDIDGIAYNKIKASEQEWQRLTRDKRHFTMMTSSRADFKGERRIGTCLGSFVCRYAECPFVMTSPGRVPNKVSWRVPKGKRNLRICNICDHIAMREGCGAKKVVEYDHFKKNSYSLSPGQTYMHYTDRHKNAQ